MAITILELAKHRGLKEEPDGSFSMGAINDVGLEIMGGCQRCGASLGCYNGCPSKSGYWMCKDGCIGDDGYETVEEANAAIFGEEPARGKTLADFVGSGKLFKRPMHFNPYTMREHLVEVEWSDRGRTFLPRLTVEDLTATDWEEVEESRDFGANNTTNTGEDGLLPALS